jgi:arylsulfatase
VSDPDRPNVVLVTIDSLRADHCSFTGYDRETTPALDALAEEGLVFTNAVAPGPVTPASMPAIFTGQHPLDAGGAREHLSSTRARTRRHMRTRRSLPERLSELGYATAGFAPNPWTSRYFGFDAGFDHFRDYMDEDVTSSVWDRMTARGGSTPLAALRLVLSWAQRANVFKPWTAFYGDALAWARSASEPYFLWLFLLDVHFPYLPDAAARTQSRWREYEANLRLYLQEQRGYSPRVHRQLETAYDDAVRYADDCIARLRADLPDDTVLAVHADHGEAFGEHGTYTHQDALYEENLHVPLVVGGGDVPSREVTDPVSLRALPDLLTGLAASGEVPPVSGPLVAARADDGERVALRGRHAKYVEGTEGDECYDLRAGERDRVRDEALAALCRRRAERVRENEREGRRVRHAADAVAEGGG